MPTNIPHIPTKQAGTGGTFEGRCNFDHLYMYFSTVTISRKKNSLPVRVNSLVVKALNDFLVKRFFELILLSTFSLFPKNSRDSQHLLLFDIGLMDHFIMWTIDIKAFILSIDKSFSEMS